MKWKTLVRYIILYLILLVFELSLRHGLSPLLEAARTSSLYISSGRKWAFSCRGPSVRTMPA